MRYFSFSSALVVLFVIGPILFAACGNNATGLPTQPGRYAVKEKSVSFDGDKYSFYWADAANTLHHAVTKDVKLQLDDDNFLLVDDSKNAVLHLKQDEPVTVEGRDRQGDFGNFWYPFLLGSMISRGGGGGGTVVVNNNGQQPPADYRQPVYRYPPTDSFDRGDTLVGNATNNQPAPPDYSRLPQVGGTVSAQNSGTGGGNAATNKADAGVASSAQTGGTGSGSAVLNKSGSFKSGSQGYSSKVDAGSARPINGSNGPSVGGGSGAGSIGMGSTKPSISTGRSSSSSSSSVSRSSSSSAPRISTSGGRRR